MAAISPLSLSCDQQSDIACVQCMYCHLKDVCKINYKSFPKSLSTANLPLECSIVPSSIHTVCLSLAHVAKGMKALREQNIVHRDLKPGNILIKHHPHTKKMLVSLSYQVM